MKQQKTISIDSELVTELGNVENGSKLINDLLTDYFRGTTSYKKQELEVKLKNLKLFIEEKQDEMFEMNEQLKRLIEEEKRLELLFKDVPKEILDDFRFFPQMTEEVLELRIREIYSKSYPDMNYKIIWNAFNEYFKERKKNENLNKAAGE